MAPAVADRPKINKSIAKQPKSSNKNVVLQYYEKYFNFSFFHSLLFNPERLSIVTYVVLFAELVLNVFIVNRVSYTEIDWVAYMQECEGFLNGTTNYALLKGDTGPLVYPAGFVYIYTVLYYLTSHGQNIKLAQYIFIAIYLVQIWLTLRLYSKSRKVPPIVLILTIFTSYRIHSIYSLRLFNDPIAMVLVYGAINLFLDGRWNWGSFVFSLGVGVKMNVLLFAPALLMLYITSLGFVKTGIQLAICGITQLVLGAPFLLTYPVEYLRGSFDLGRIFEHKWTVNYRFLTRAMFENKIFHFGLLGVHLLLLALFFKPCYLYLKSYSRLRQLQLQLQPQIDKENKEIAQGKKQKKKKQPKEEPLTEDQQMLLNSFEQGLKQQNPGAVKKPVEESKFEKYQIHFEKATQLVILPLFLANFIGLACARSLHYQFYVWYFHSLPYLSWFTDYHVSFKLLILFLIEFCWNQYPSTIYSSSLLHMCHLMLLVGIARKLLKSSSLAKTALSQKQE